MGRVDVSQRVPVVAVGYLVILRAGNIPQLDIDQGRIITGLPGARMVFNQGGRLS